MFIGLETCFFYVVVATYVISGCHASLDISSTAVLNTTNSSTVRRITDSTKQSALSEGMSTYTIKVSTTNYQKAYSSSIAFTRSDKLGTYSTEQISTSVVFVGSPDLSSSMATVDETATYSATASLSSNLELTTTYSTKEVASTAASSVGRITDSTKQSALSEGMSTYTIKVSTTNYQKAYSSSITFTRSDKIGTYSTEQISTSVVFVGSPDLSSSMATVDETATYSATASLSSNLELTTTYSTKEVASTAASSVGRITDSTKQSALSEGMSTYTIKVSTTNYQKAYSSSIAFTRSDKIGTYSTEQTSTSVVFVGSPDLSPSMTTATQLAPVIETSETATSAIYSATASSPSKSVELPATTYSSKELVTSTAGMVTTNVPFIQSGETTSFSNTDSTASFSRMTTYSNSTIEPTVSGTMSSYTAITLTKPSRQTATNVLTVPTTEMVNSTTNVSTQSSKKPDSSNSTRSSEMTTYLTQQSLAYDEKKSRSKNSTCFGAIAKPATFPTEYKVIIIVCLVVVLILLVGCIIERKRCWNVENSKETRNKDDIQVIPLTIQSTTATTATNPMYSFGGCIDQKEAPETSTVDQEPGSKSETKQTDGTHVIEIELHPQSQNQKNSGDHATSSDAVDNIAQPSTSKAEDGRGDSDKDSGKDGGESGTSKPEVASKSECAPKEADVKQVEPSTKPAKDELGPQSQGDTPDNKSDGVQDNKNGKDGGEEVSGKPEADAKSECEPTHKTDVEQVDNSTQDVSEDGQQPQLREINLGDITIKEMKLF